MSEFYAHNIVEEAKNASALADNVREFLRSIGVNFTPKVRVFQPDPIGSPCHTYLALASGKSERTVIGEYNPTSEQRVGYRQKIEVEFMYGAYLHLRRPYEGFEVTTEGELRSKGRYNLPLGTIEYGPVMKETGILADGHWCCKAEEVTSMSWEEVPQGISEMMAAAIG